MFEAIHRFKLGKIDQALSSGEISLTFQPKVNLALGTISGVEAFLRWRHPDFGIIPPVLFIGQLELTGHMSLITRFAVREALKATSLWRRSGRHIGVSVNLSEADVANTELPGIIRDALEATGTSPEMLTLELPNSITYLGGDRRLSDGEAPEGEERRADESISKAWNRILKAVNALRATGVGISLDGRGDALKVLEMTEAPAFSEIKIGGDTIRQLAVAGSTPETVVDPARLRFARDMGIDTVAVGVENDRMLDAAVSAGFTHAQGLYVSRPITALAILQWEPVMAGDAAPKAIAAEPATAAADTAPAPPPRPLSALGRALPGGGEGTESFSRPAEGAFGRVFGQRRRILN